MHIAKADWAVRDVSIDVARLLVEQWHYAQGASNTGTYLHGLFPVGAFWESDCVGVAWWIPPTKSAALATYPRNWEGVLALSRLVIVPGMPTNAATFLLARSRRLIDSNRWPCLVTYADQWRGHTGQIYKADNWTYLGMTGAEATYTLNGRMIGRKAGPTTRTHAEMLAMGCVFEGRHAKHKFVRVVPRDCPRRDE
jgi:hypothetical protein